MATEKKETNALAQELISEQNRDEHKQTTTDITEVDAKRSATATIHSDTTDSTDPLNDPTDTIVAHTSTEASEVDATAAETAAVEAKHSSSSSLESERGSADDPMKATEPPEPGTVDQYHTTLTCGSTSVIRRVLCSDEDALTGIVSASVRDVSVTPMDPTLPDNDGTEVGPEHAEEDDNFLDEFTEDSDISPPHRRIWIVTTAALPWRTGTAVNPLLRALYLTRGRPRHYVTLVIPWLEKESSRKQLYGEQNAFLGGRKEQEAWIREYCRTRAQCKHEEHFLRIQFYSAVYNKAFGSIFPSEDICSLIPDDEADIAILEEPEHLNWFRVMPKPRRKKKSAAIDVDKNDDDQEQDAVDSIEVKSEASSSAVDPIETATADDPAGLSSVSEIEAVNKDSLGWARKFRHSVGILHTNYSAYMTQYAIGTSFIAAPAIGMLSSIVVRAYCHRVIRLSDVLPSLVANREITCNVHGVRAEFLLPPVELDDPSQRYAKVYFIGKLIWAKGFDKVLEMQELFRQATGEYLEMDVYGAGPDEKAIRRAFHGRKGEPKEDEAAPDSAPPEIQQSASESSDASAAAVFEKSNSLRKQFNVLSATAEESDILGIEVEQIHDSPTKNAVQITSVSGEGDETPPLSVLGDLGSTSIATGLEASQAVYGLAESLVKAGLKMTVAKLGPTEDTGDANNSFFLDPPKSRYEWRRNPIPTRFLGVKDHALLRDVSEHTVFLNMSITEVLCTTTAEALAMGKWVVIPKHPSNTFFLPFRNCLAYETLPECVAKLRQALDNPPAVLSNEEHHKFTWEGATDRLFQAAGITRRELRDGQSNDVDHADERIAWFHSQSLKTGNLIRKVFSNSALDKMEEKEGA